MYTANKLKIRFSSSLARLTIIGIISFIGSIVLLLSNYGVLPTFPIFKERTTIEGVLISMIFVAVGILLVYIGERSYKSMVDTINNGSIVPAKVTGISKSRNSHEVNYTFSYDGEDQNHSMSIIGSHLSKKKYEEGDTIEIFVKKSDKGKIRSILPLFFDKA